MSGNLPVLFLVAHEPIDPLHLPDPVVECRGSSGRRSKHGPGGHPLRALALQRAHAAPRSRGVGDKHLTPEAGKETSRENSEASTFGRPGMQCSTLP